MPDTRFSLDQYRAILESLPDPTFILTESGRYAAILGGKDKRYYHDGSSLVGKWLSDVLVPQKTQWFLQQIHAALESQQMLVTEYELSVHDVLGVPTEGPVEPIWFEGRITALADLYDGERAVVWVASNITISKRQQQQLQQQALSDELTGLHNRRRLMAVLQAALTQFQKHGTPAALLSFDVDHFKAINDGLGHPAGDQALRDLARAMEQLAQPQDWVCRLGGDEFAIVCQGRTMAEITAFAQQLLHTGRKVLQAYDTPAAKPSISLGIAIFSLGDHHIEDILRRADQALYASKTQGGHQMSTLACPTGSLAELL